MEEDKDEVEDGEDDSLLTSKESFRMITKLFLARFTVLKKVVTDGRTDRRNNGPTERRKERFSVGPWVTPFSKTAN